MEELLKGLRLTPPVSSHERVLYAGLREHEIEYERRAIGIPYHPDVVQYFRNLAAELGVQHQL